MVTHIYHQGLPPMCTRSCYSSHLFNGADPSRNAIGPTRPDMAPPCDHNLPAVNMDGVEEWRFHIGMSYEYHHGSCKNLWICACMCIWAEEDMDTVRSQRQGWRIHLFIWYVYIHASCWPCNATHNLSITLFEPTSFSMCSCFVLHGNSSAQKFACQQIPTGLRICYCKCCKSRCEYVHVITT